MFTGVDVITSMHGIDEIACISSCTKFAGPKLFIKFASRPWLAKEIKYRISGIMSHKESMIKPLPI